MAGFGPGTQLPPELETGPVFDTATPITQAIAGAGQPGFAPPPMAPPMAMAPPPAVNFASMTPEQIGAAAGASQAQQGYGSPPPVPAALPMPGGGPGVAP